MPALLQMYFFLSHFYRERNANFGYGNFRFINILEIFSSKIKYFATLAHFQDAFCDFRRLLHQDPYPITLMYCNRWQKHFKEFVGHDLPSNGRSGQTAWHCSFCYGLAKTWSCAMHYLISALGLTEDIDLSELGWDLYGELPRWNA